MRNASSQNAALRRFGRLLIWRFGLRGAPERREAKETRRKDHERRDYNTICDTTPEPQMKFSLIRAMCL